MTSPPSSQAIKPAEIPEPPWVRRSLLQEKQDSKIRCNVCERRCLLTRGGLGWCRTRQNRDGTLVTLIYGLVSSLSANPIEKKPFYHFHPGTRALTAGSWSCNFGCPWCQNWDISKAAPPYKGEYISPERFLELVEKFDAGLDAMNVDVKGGGPEVKKLCKAVDVEKVWAVSRLACRHGVHLEITTLVIPTVNDSDATLRGIAKRIATELGRQVPWHVTAYFPAYRFTAPPTPMRTLEQAWQIGKEAGLDYVYVGNIAGRHREYTYCPRCGTVLIRRSGFDVIENIVRSGHCPRCGQQIAGAWQKS
jgi:pyruvate formate lyase activating enzyme